MKNLLDPTRAQAKHRNRLWASALKENKKKARNVMTDGCGGRCCLAVAQDVAESCGVTVDKDIADEVPCEATVNFFGWPNNNPNLFITNKNNSLSATEINDGYDYEGEHRGLPHSLIAEAVLNTFVHPKTRKNIFK